MLSAQLLNRVAREINNRLTRTDIEDFFIEHNFVSEIEIRDEDDYKKFSKYEFVREILRGSNQYDILYQYQDLYRFSIELLKDLERAGIDFSDDSEEIEPQLPKASQQLNQPTPAPGAATVPSKNDNKADDVNITNQPKEILPGPPGEVLITKHLRERILIRTHLLKDYGTITYIENLGMDLLGSVSSRSLGFFLDL